MIEEVELLNQQTEDYQAQFTQTLIDSTDGSSKVSGGTVYFKKPRRMRWIYKDTEKSKTTKEVISDGSKLWVYEPEFKHAFQQCIGDFPPTLNFLMGRGDLLKTFDASLSKKSTNAMPRVKLIPKKKTPLYKEIYLTLNSKTFEVVETGIFDHYGNRKKIAFSDSKINKNLPDSGFAFKIPKSARLLNPKKQCP